MIAAEYVYKTCVNNKRVIENNIFAYRDRINFLRLNMITVYKKRV